MGAVKGTVWLELVPEFYPWRPHDVRGFRIGRKWTRDPSRSEAAAGHLIVKVTLDVPESVLRPQVEVTIDVPEAPAATGEAVLS